MDDLFRLDIVVPALTLASQLAGAGAPPLRVLAMSRDGLGAAPCTS
jgi:hypothetical protein